MIPTVRDILLEVFSILGGRIDSRKKIHKIIHILKVNGFNVPVNYTFGLYGPYSYELDAMLYMLLEDGIITKEQRPEGITIYSLSKKVDVKALQGKYAKLVEELGSFAPWELEIISTVIYFNPSADINDCVSIVNSVKPNKFSEEDIKKTWLKYIELTSQIE